MVGWDLEREVMVRELLVGQLLVGALVERPVMVGSFLERPVVERDELVRRRLVLMVRLIVLSLAARWQRSVASLITARDRWDTSTWLARSWG
jgi:hypothetical protein